MSASSEIAREARRGSCSLRVFRWVAVLACLILVSGCSSKPSPATPGFHADRTLADRVEANVQGWFAFFGNPAELSGELASFLSYDDFVFLVRDQIQYQNFLRRTG